ncbi:acetyl-CoA carboxylase biotin carboxyl carrier protein subunit [Caballeronia udeis]|uniref:Acetyl-CoA carboxylase biotin carboxyl carrier protein subunit n=1 Tax=Caballeronia udeis TaxID=1232866 RepID=A0A158J1I4_9BURK|nr:acetyl-CoA carboxylase biotin carboxyl carrier protein subunit [Caballeronia udeis]SAL62180.1 acetyl-CoA carboxylase biotin carboxyl carrier protein subunit [Caballeronia udeis]
MTQGKELQISELRQITAWLETAGIGFIEIGGKGTLVRLTLEGERDGEGSAAANPQPAPSVRQTQVIALSPGVLLTCHPMRSTPFVEPGWQVRQGDVLGLLRIAELCLPVVAPCDGVVVAWLVEPGATVGYGSALMNLAPAGNI